MDESAAVIAGLLSIAEGLEPPKALDDIDYLERILWAADKYEMPAAISTIHLALFSSLLDASPIRLYGIACRMSWEAEAKQASTRTLTLDLFSPAVMSELASLVPAHREKLLALHRRRRDAFLKGLDDKVAFYANDGTSVCNEDEDTQCTALNSHRA